MVPVRNFSYDAKSMRDVWKSITPGEIKAGTLFWQAQQAGWRDDGSHQRPSAEELAKRQSEQQEAAERAKAEAEQDQKHAAELAAAILRAAKPALADNPYLARKGLEPTDNLFELDVQHAANLIGYPPKVKGEPLQGRLLVVPIQRDGAVCSLELIDGAGRKTALRGRGTKAAGFWASYADLPETVADIAVTEGVADALTCSVAGAGLAVAGLSDGNLLAVARTMRQRYQDARITLVADLKDGAPNPHAVAAAKATGGFLAVPDFGQQVGKDIDDLREVCGIDAVQNCLAGAQSFEPPSEDAILAVAGIENKFPFKTLSAITSIPPRDDELRRAVGHALHQLTNGSGAGFAMWRSWCVSEHGELQCRIDWTAFADMGASDKSIFDLAREQSNWEWSRQAKTEQFDSAMTLVEQVIEAVKTDATAHLTPGAIEAFSIVQAVDELEYEAVRTRLKAANPKVRVGSLDKFIHNIELADGLGGSDQSDATALVDLAAERCQLWHDQERNAYATLQRDEVGGRSHFEHWAVESSGYREWLAWLAHSEMGKAPSNETLSAARNALQGKGKFDGEEHHPFKRIGKDANGYWIDLCNDSWQAVLVTAAGWKIFDRPSIRFTRTPAMRPLPMPQAGGDYRKLWDLVNIPEEEQPLVLAWVLECFRCDTPYAVLELIGEQGSAKSSTQRALRDLIDPNQVALRGKPKDVETVYVAARNNHVVSLENLSGITADVSDALCTIATGGGTASRTLYTNGEESIIEVHNPVVLNGIAAVITRNDLLDRAVALCLPTIKDRRTEDDVKADFDRYAPSMFGGLLDLFSASLAQIANVKIPSNKLPRMADFAILGEAMSMAQGNEPGQWLDLYRRHRRDAIRRTIDTSPVAVQCLEFVNEGRNYHGTVKGLLQELSARLDAKSLEHGEYWPRSPKGFADSLRRAAPALRQLGVTVSVDTKAQRDGVHCHLGRIREDDGEHQRPGILDALATPHNRKQSSPSSQGSHETAETEVFEI